MSRPKRRGPRHGTPRKVSHQQAARHTKDTPRLSLVAGGTFEVLGADDSRWFKRNPGEDVRYRPAGAEEWAPGLLSGPPYLPPGMAAELMVEVVQLAPGVRVRRPHWIVGVES